MGEAVKVQLNSTYIIHNSGAERNPIFTIFCVFSAVMGLVDKLGKVFLTAGQLSHAKPREKQPLPRRPNQ